MQRIGMKLIHSDEFKFMHSQRVGTDLRHWLSNKFFVAGENSAHRFFYIKPCDQFLNREHRHLTSGYVQVTSVMTFKLARSFSYFFKGCQEKKILFKQAVVPKVPI